MRDKDRLSRHILQHALEESGLRIFSESAIASGFNHTYDLARVIGAIARIQTAADWILARPILLRSGLVDNRHAGRTSAIALQELTSLQQRRAHGFEIARPDT